MGRRNSEQVRQSKQLRRHRRKTRSAKQRARTPRPAATNNRLVTEATLEREWSEVEEPTQERAAQ
jgi:hypothetical protein